MFHKIDLESACKASYIKVFEGADNKAPLKETFCGKQSKKIVVSRKQTMLVQFLSADLAEGTGFLATATSVTVNEGNTDS